jgi:hypothetical protein
MRRGVLDISDRVWRKGHIGVRKRLTQHNLYRAFEHRLDMSVRIRHCVQCPKCLTLYLVSASPFTNGSYLVHTVPRSLDEYTLYCACSSPSASSRWRGAEVKRCEISKAAHERGFGSLDEIAPLDSPPRKPWKFDLADYLNSPATRTR